jgi:hypothetical protein
LPSGNQKRFQRVRAAGLPEEATATLQHDLKGSGQPWVQGSGRRLKLMTNSPAELDPRELRELASFTKR